jgi:hypothetical protein
MFLKVNKVFGDLTNKHFSLLERLIKMPEDFIEGDRVEALLKDAKARTRYPEGFSAGKKM